MAADINPSAMDVDPPESQSDGDAHDDEDDNDSRSTIGQCIKCGSDIGEFFNSWIKGTGSYYLPAMVGSYQLINVREGKPKLANDSSSLSEW